MHEKNYNPDVLTCLANLSNDEVFTPPNVVNAVLDMLPKELWKDKNLTFLDPVCKSGVFLREIAKRLMTGLEEQIPNKQKRINHIFTKQLYGIAITELTSLLSRRSVYCSKAADGKYSVCDSFDTNQGNILFGRTEHTWQNGQCTYCGASQEVYKRSEELETHAYRFIHADEPDKLFNMKFDVIVGNPPYQLSDGGFGASAAPIYHKFVQQAKRLNPRFLSMIIPSRWFAGGRVGELNEFRNEMLNDDRIRILHDFPKAGDCFPGVDIKGGVNYFLWERDNKGLCEINTHDGDKVVSTTKRRLLEEGVDVFIRINEAIPILKKVSKHREKSFATIVSANDPFGFDVRVENSMKRVTPDFKKSYFENSVAFYYNGWRNEGLGYIEKSYVRKNPEWVKMHKIFVPKAIGTGESKTDYIKPFVPENNSCCSETYIVIGPFTEKAAINNVLSLY